MKLSCTAYTPEELKDKIVKYIRQLEKSWACKATKEITKIEKHASQTTQICLGLLADSLEDMEILQ